MSFDAALSYNDGDTWFTRFTKVMTKEGMKVLAADKPPTLDTLDLLPRTSEFPGTVFACYAKWALIETADGPALILYGGSATGAGGVVERKRQHWVNLLMDLIPWVHNMEVGLTDSGDRFIELVSHQNVISWQMDISVLLAYGVAKHSTTD